MIKPRSQPSYFEVEAEGKEWKVTGTVPHILKIPLLQSSHSQSYQLYHLAVWFQSL